MSKHTFIIVMQADPGKELVPDNGGACAVDEIEIGIMNGLAELGWRDIVAASTVSLLPYSAAIPVIEHIMQAIEKAALDKLSAAPES